MRYLIVVAFLVIGSFSETRADVGGWNWNVNVNGTNYNYGVNLGAFDANNLSLSGGWGNTWQNGGDDACHIVLEYSVSNGGPSGSLIIDYVSPHGNTPGDKYHSKQDYNINISNMSAGSYVLTVVYKIYGRHSGTTCGTSGNTNEFTTAGLESQTLDFTINSPLTVKFATFTAENKGLSNVLSWQTYSEINNKYFEIQRSSDNRKFLKMGSVKGQGNSSTLQAYEFIDANPLSGTNYYRIKQVDFEGSNAYSPILKVVLFQPQRNVILFPNPVQECIRIEGLNEEEFSVHIFDHWGRLVKFLPQGWHSEIPVNELVSGIYWIHIKSDLNTYYFKVMKSTGD